MLGLIYVYETKELMVVESSQNTNLADLASTMSKFIPRSANLAKTVHRFPLTSTMPNLA